MPCYQSIWLPRISFCLGLDKGGYQRFTLHCRRCSHNLTMPPSFPPSFLSSLLLSPFLDHGHATRITSQDSRCRPGCSRGCLERGHGLKEYNACVCVCMCGCTKNQNAIYYIFGCAKTRHFNCMAGVSLPAFSFTWNLSLLSPTRD